MHVLPPRLRIISTINLFQLQKSHIYVLQSVCCSRRPFIASAEHLQKGNLIREHLIFLRRMPECHCTPNAVLAKESFSWNSSPVASSLLTLLRTLDMDNCCENCFSVIIHTYVSNCLKECFLNEEPRRVETVGCWKIFLLSRNSINNSSNYAFYSKYMGPVQRLVGSEHIV